MEDVKKELEQIAEQTKKSVDEKITKATENLVTKSEVEGFVAKAEYDELKKKAEDIEAAARTQGEEITALKMATENATANKNESLYDIVTKALEEHKDKLKELQTTKNTQGGFVMEIKANNSTITTGYASSSPNAYLPVPQYIPGFFKTPEIDVTIMDLVNFSSTNTPVITWVNEQPIEGDAGWTAEGALKAQVAWKYTSETATAKKVTAFVKVTDESLKDIPFLANRIVTRLRELILRKMQEGIINGDGSSNSPIGITDGAPGYTTNSFDDSVATPTTADALMAMAGQIDELEYDTNNLVAVMNGVDIRKMKWEKDADGNYIIPPFTTTNGTYVDNMRVVKNNAIAAGYALVGDLKRFMVLMVDNLTVEMGLDGNDFTYNLRTIRAEARLITAISDNDLNAFVYDAIATVKTEIDSAV